MHLTVLPPPLDSVSPRKISTLQPEMATQSASNYDTRLRVQMHTCSFPIILGTSDLFCTVVPPEWQYLFLGEDMNKTERLTVNSNAFLIIRRNLASDFGHVHDSVRRGRRKLAHPGGCYLYQSARYQRGKCESSKDARYIHNGRRSDSVARHRG